MYWLWSPLISAKTFFAVTWSLPRMYQMINHDWEILGSNRGWIAKNLRNYHHGWLQLGNSQQLSRKVSNLLRNYVFTHRFERFQFFWWTFCSLFARKAFVWNKLIVTRTWMAGKADWKNRSSWRIFASTGPGVWLVVRLVLKMLTVLKVSFTASAVRVPTCSLIVSRAKKRPGDDKRLYLWNICACV